ncbi:alpha-glucan family phosphorylase [Dactylococcopsis salina]|uniref:glycogen phosphorylase n=1 Tax=Dactylococcopsis salina (strain PCC 8305) TaxID=13035 RepID=K9YT13_DACS8|nr:alpha-glucan family phosphorylase [Dactylococcopsis salina]AFZ49218.1 alpha-glucan phosphorylase [Dactylococcopsis salina PCC 8305]
MKPIRTFNVSPSLPPKLEPLKKLAYNIHWDWNVETKDLFRRLDNQLWESCRHNPVALLGNISQSRLAEVAEDEGFIAQMERAEEQLDLYLQERNWFRKNRQQALGEECYAYFCAEYGLTDCLPLYSGGLGVLAGDHLKSASDLGLPLIAVGLLYQEGYFSQYLNADGWQQEAYPISDFSNMPLHLERKSDGSELRVEVDYPGRTVIARVWRIDVGGVRLYLLDTNIEGNSEYDHNITDRLYGGDLDMRIHQEMMLGIGGFRALKALGYTPTVFHLNEGHSAFLVLERMRRLIEDDGLSFEEAKQMVQASQMFTTHTPVSAGFDMFNPDQTMYYVGHYADIFGLSREEFLAMGRENTGDLSSPFSMAALALRTSSFLNGVSKLHGEVSRDMFKGMWKGLPVSEVPITSITNGTHARSVVAKSTQQLYDRYLGPNWSDKGPDDPLWEKVNAIPDDELWRNHERARADMVVMVRDWLGKKLRQRGASQAELDKATEVLDPNVLTIGFARRFATYKRATLFLRDIDRIKKIIMGNPDRRLQFVIAGKAHPKDMPGKELIRQLIHIAREEGIEEYLVFVPDYDTHVARAMVSGCDIWLNTPRRPREASGTSGMKAAMNGLPNLSVLDGWWDEADYTATGWAIGQGEIYEDQHYQDEVEANALYDLLEQEILPLFYDRDANGVPRGWVQKMKNAIRLNIPQFNTARMLRDYSVYGYFPSSDRYFAMTENNYANTKAVAQWKKQVFERWYDIRIESIDVSEETDIVVNETIEVKAVLDLAGLKPDDVSVELYLGKLNSNGEIVNGTPIPMEHTGETTSAGVTYKGSLVYRASGLQGLSLRVLPKNQYMAHPHELGLILWADDK